MSYDLEFLRRKDSAVLPREALLEHFESRRGYSLEGKQWWYRNEDTGVYFCFETPGPEDAAEDKDAVTEHGADEGAGDGLVSAGLSFNLNYFRPHYFGLEAEIELSALVQRFSLLVDDPQNEGVGRGSYSRAGFLRGWNAGNLVGHQAILSQMAKDGGSPAKAGADLLPAETLERAWTWNLHRSRLQTTLGDDVFVPTIMFVRHEGRVKTLIVWGDAIPVAVPPVDLVVVVRDELAPRRFFFRKRDTCVVPFDRLAPLLALAQPSSEPVAHHVFRHSTAPAPARLVEFFRVQQPHQGKLDLLSADTVLTKEMVDEARAKLPDLRQL